MSSSSPLHFDPPSTILILGAGVFGLTTCLSLLQSPNYKNTKIVIVDPYSPSPSSGFTSASHTTFTSPHTASHDSSRLVRADYASTPYARLASEAQKLWRKDAEYASCYHEGGIAFISDNVSEYVERARVNVENLGESKTENHGKAVIEGSQKTERKGIEKLADNTDILKSMGISTVAPASLTYGYVNWSSGFCNATAAMNVLLSRVQAFPSTRVQFISSRATRLLPSPESVIPKRRKIIGVQIESGETVEACLTILAMGAWSGGLLDLNGRAEASGQVVGYVQLSDGERERFRGVPVLFDLGTGLFVVPPMPGQEGLLKVARHSYGYRNPSTSTVLGSAGQEVDITVSLPGEDYGVLPDEGRQALKEGLKKLVPWLEERVFASERICWYTDTSSGDFMVDWHPEFEGLFMATGGSGHGFKFLPVLGERIVEALEGRLREELQWPWRWPGESVNEVWTEDGSRGGRRGLRLAEEQKKRVSQGASKL